MDEFLDLYFFIGAGGNFFEGEFQGKLHFPAPGTAGPGTGSSETKIGESASAKAVHERAEDLKGIDFSSAVTASEAS